MPVIKRLYSIVDLDLDAPYLVHPRGKPRVRPYRDYVAQLEAAYELSIARGPPASLVRQLLSCFRLGVNVVGVAPYDAMFGGAGMGRQVCLDHTIRFRMQFVVKLPLLRMSCLRRTGFGPYGTDPV